MQTNDAVLVHAEMIHDARVIHMNRPHLPASIRLWMGDSVGRWDGQTPGGRHHQLQRRRRLLRRCRRQLRLGRHLHIVERFSLFDPDTLLYQFEIDNPTAFTRPWKGELTMTRSTGSIYEFACHEGNYSLENMLRGARAAERKPGGR